jgi:hypothetical protein
LLPAFAQSCYWLIRVAVADELPLDRDPASQLVFPSGIVFPPGSAMEVLNIPASSGQVIVYLGGY